MTSITLPRPADGGRDLSSTAEPDRGAPVTCFFYSRDAGGGDLSTRSAMGTRRVVNGLRADDCDYNPRSCAVVYHGRVHHIDRAVGLFRTISCQSSEKTGYKCVCGTRTGQALDVARRGTLTWCSYTRSLRKSIREGGHGCRCPSCITISCSSVACRSSLCERRQRHCGGTAHVGLQTRRSSRAQIAAARTRGNRAVENGRRRDR